MVAYSPGSTKNLKHDEEKPHAAGSKTEKKRKKVLKDDEKAAGSKKKKKKEADRTFEELLEVKEEPEEEDPGWKMMKVKLTEADVRHMERYPPYPPDRLSDLNSADPNLFSIAKRAAARHEARIESCKRAIEQFKAEGSAEIEMMVLVDPKEHKKNVAHIHKFFADLK